LAKAGLLFVGTAAGLVLFSEPGAAGRWLRVGHELQQLAIESLWLGIDTPLEVVASSADELWRSADGGQRWERVPAVPGGVLAGHRAAPQAIWCGTAGAVWRSADGGLTWDQIGSGAWRRPIALATSDGAQHLALASAEQLWMSADGGQSWRENEAPMAPLGGLAAAAGELDSWYVSAGGSLFLVAATSWHEVEDAPQVAGALAVLGGKEPTLLIALPDGQVGRHTPVGWEMRGAEAGWKAAPATLVAASYHIDTAFAGGAGTIALSTDRGRNWHVLRHDLPTIHCLAAGRLL
jgi:photosystem II stability/assembly factor-like uncharacterized protein